MFNKLEEVVHRYESIEHQLQNPSVAADQDKFRGLMKEHRDLEKIVKPFQEYKKLKIEIEENKELLTAEKDAELREMIREEVNASELRVTVLEDELKLALLPKDPNDDKNIILEVRAGAGGDEASLFAEELYSAYNHYAQGLGWQVEVLSISHGNVGGYKEVVAMITGDKVYSTMKFESGVHRVQRVPATEAQGRVHTSTITVAVIPEAEEVEVKLNPQEIRIDVCRASGAGGQHVNKTDSAVRLTHLPTNTVVFCQDGRSQHQNKDKAFKILYAKLKALEDEKAIKEASDARLAQIGTGDRSERIRTYNFPQSRITDHRIGLTTHNITEVMKGHLDALVQPLIAYFQAEALKAQQNDPNAASR
ncbi:MAG: peptide chain release factor 1 [Bdellovibrionaceae bacterium]|nr:peptide chain release factor 1 [Pseudobdellovibrionaceae bacterium]